MLRIRRAGLRDLPEIYRVEKASFSDPWPLLAFLPYILEHDNMAFVAEEGRVVAFILAVREGGEVHIHDLAVAPEHRRKGIATALLAHVIREAKGARCLRLEVRASNTAARAFYQKQGFREAALLPSYYADGEDGILMIRDLAAD
ncbi:MAG: ribosomal protein S18-alanine N-acetyltransferase [Candidatus Bipolaricaulota bacterium]|nr:ribosomal protein S18-alanine N-acetyltransferase [Candidatus Bipolaricaulota bacterium]MDW8126178.1 ribosomal protein S18-alanine N-acetyltransferase [Candidatus Bipolaricaulota bacterium]